MPYSKLSLGSKRASSVTFGLTHAKRFPVSVKTIVLPERMTYRILLDGVDVTPKFLTPPSVQSEEHEVATHDMAKISENTFSAQQSAFHTQLHYQTVRAEHNFLSQHGTAITITGRIEF